MDATPLENPPRAMRSLFQYDAALPPPVAEMNVERRDGVSIHGLRYTAERTVDAYLVVPDGDGPHAAVLFVHPAPGDRSTFLDEARNLARLGTVSLLVDAPWTRERAQAWGMALADPAQAVREHAAAVIALRRGLDLLAARRDVDAGRLGFVGHSIGALMGGILSGIEKRVRAYVLMAGSGSFTDVAVLNMPDLEGAALERYRRAMDPIDPIFYVPHAAPAALLFQFGLQDAFFPREKSLAFFEQASDPKAIRWYEAGHYLNDEARRERVEWLTDQLQRQ